MTFWEAMIDEARKYFMDNCCDADENGDSVIEYFGFNKEFSTDTNDGNECFLYGDFLCKSENGKITNLYYLYDLYSWGTFGENNEMFLAVGNEYAVVINVETFEVLKEVRY